jgi:heptaprenyl diphosphate synthase
MLNFDFTRPIAKELNLVEAKLTENVDSKLSLLNEASNHLIKAGGKRMRPAFALLSAKFFKDDLQEIIPLAVALELVHMATLVHDDVIDNSQTRRGRDTVNKTWGNRMSIYSGNYIFARSLSLIAAYERSDVIEVMADASTKICEGEIIQMLSCYNVELGLKNYLRRIERKTALLISLSCQLGAMLCNNASKNDINALRLYGYYLGMAFQITDDILDFTADEKVLGKPAGSDIRQGVITLPVLYALKNDKHNKELANLIRSPELCVSAAERIIDIIVNSGGIEYAYNVTARFVYKAQRQLEPLPDVAIKSTLLYMTDFIQERAF